MKLYNGLFFQIVPVLEKKMNEIMKKLLTCMLLAGTGFIYADNYQVRRCCTDAYSATNGYFAGPDRAWREENIAPDNFTIYRRSEYRPTSFTDLAEQPQISGFERSVYTSPK